MNMYIGIDLGTSAVKLLLLNAEGQILGEQGQSYPVFYPKSGWSEQNPEDWWTATVQSMKKLLEGRDPSLVKGISFGGQMHGLVVLDSKDQVIRPCILWNDGRTEKETAYLNEAIGRERLSDYTGNIAFAGFTAPKILWLQKNEPQHFKRIAKIMLPKDYLAYRFCGVFSTDYSDASGTLLLDVKNKCWSESMCQICGINVAQLPQLYESFAVVGTLKSDVGRLIGLSQDVKIIAGAGDNAAAAVGTGTVGKNACNVSLGTSGTVFLSCENFHMDSKNALHSFAHADGKWHLMGCILSAASARKWWLEEILDSTDYALDEQAVLEANTDGLFFLPYLMGERSPHNDVNARGAFIGLSATTTKGQMSKALMEGVAFALKDCLEVAKSNGVMPDSTNICGGGAKSAAWRQIVADIFNLPTQILSTEQGPAFGSAMLAMVGCGEYKDVVAAAEALVRIQTRIMPQLKSVKNYQKKYDQYKKLYPALKQIFADIANTTLE